MSAGPIKILVAGSDGVVISEYLLGDGEHIVGSATGSAIPLESAAPEHAQLSVRGDEMFIENLAGAESGGTFLDGVSVLGRLRMYSGQTIQVSDRWLALQMQTQVQPGKNDLLAGRYRLIRQLGRGGRGEVWLACDEQLRTEIAIKRLPAELLGDATALSSLMREVQKSRHLNHENIIRIHDLIQPEEEPPFVTLEYIDGQDLAALRLQQPNLLFKWEDLRPLMTQLCDALEYAHQNKIVHRDLKPANMMIDQQGKLKLADFGIAATLAESLSRSSMQGNVSGTSVYMSPQQTKGEIPRASDDVYALGSTFYELLTSRTPFFSGDIAYQVINETPKPLAERLKQLGLENLVPDAVCAMIMACLAKDPEKRPPSAASVEEWISEGVTAQTLPAVETRVTSSSLPNIPDNADHLPSQDTQPSVPPIISKASVGVDEAAHADAHTPGNQPVASAKWASIESRDNPARQKFHYAISILVLLLLVSMKSNPPALVGMLVLVLIFSLVGRLLIRPKCYNCSECNQKLPNNILNECPNCNASLS